MSDLAPFLFAAAALNPTRARSARRFAAAVAELAAKAGVAGSEGLDALAERLRRTPLTGGEQARLRVLGEDLAALVAAGEAQRWPWAPSHGRYPERARDRAEELEQAKQRMEEALAGIGLSRKSAAPLHMCDVLPGPYAVAPLLAVSLDAADASAHGLEPGIYLAAGRLPPLAAELALGHVLVHAALGERSPELLGRGLEEGLCEVLGGIFAAGRVLGEDTADRAFAALRLTPDPPPHRQRLLASTRAAALLFRRHGLKGLAALADGGRGVVKEAERALGTEWSAPIEVSPTAPRDAATADLTHRLDRLLQQRPEPQTVSPLSLLVARAIAGGAASVAAAAADLGIAPAEALAAAGELAGEPFLLVLGPGGEVLAHDLALALATGELRYEL